MDKITPPRGSPEEIQAWNNMMDTMVTFIKASTTLMNTITTKMVIPKSAIKSTDQTDCEEGCEVCRPAPPKPKCGICLPDNVTEESAKQEKSTSRVSFQEPLIEITQQIGNSKNNSKNDITATDTIMEESPQNDEDNLPVPAEDTEETVPEPPAEENPEETDNVPADTNQLKEQDIQDKKGSNGVVPSPSSGDTKRCICSAIRAKRIQEEEKAEEDKLNEPKEEIETVCGCGPTEGNTEAEMKEMVEKLAKAQGEIADLQQQMARLQRLSSTKRFGPQGGPNTASLYREIMRNNELCPAGSSFRTQSLSRQRSYQQETFNNTSLPTDFAPKYHNSALQLTACPASTKTTKGSLAFSQVSVPRKTACRPGCNPQNAQTNINSTLGNQVWQTNPGNFGSATAFASSGLGSGNWTGPGSEQYSGYPPYQNPMAISMSPSRCPASLNGEPRRVIVECRQIPMKPPEDSDLY